MGYEQVKKTSNLKVYAKAVMVFLVSVSAASYAGTKDGGGGKAVVCRDQNQKITSAELFDLYEGRIQYRMNPILSNAEMSSQETNFINQLSSGRESSFAQELKYFADDIQQSMILLPDGTALVPIDDVANVIVPENCKLEQLARYTEQNQILVKGDIWRELGPTNQAALIAHEAIYKFFREAGGEQNSLRARKSVAYVVSGGKMQNIYEGIPKEHLNCHTVANLPGQNLPTSYFFAYEDPKSHHILFQFDFFQNHYSLTKTTTVIPYDYTLQDMSKIRGDWGSQLNSVLDQNLSVSGGTDLMPDGSLKLFLGSPAEGRAQFSCESPQDEDPANAN